MSLWGGLIAGQIAGHRPAPPRGWVL